MKVAVSDECRQEKGGRVLGQHLLAADVDVRVRGDDFVADLGLPFANNKECGFLPFFRKKLMREIFSNLDIFSQIFLFKIVFVNWLALKRRR